ncbi:MAG: AraC family transcriptional regulator [bacterium]
MHRVEIHRSTVVGIEAMTLLSNHHFPRHAHDQFGIGVMLSGAQRSWSGLGQVSASAGDVIMVNPGEMHDGAPFADTARGWRMIYLDPALVMRTVEDDVANTAEIVRPVVHDPLLASSLARLFARLTNLHAEPLGQEEELIRSLAYALGRHGTAKPSSSRASPSVAKAVERLDAALDAPVSLAELAALSGVSRFQLLRGFARELGITPHAYLVQRRVRLAQEYLRQRHTPAMAAVRAGFADQSHMTRAFVRQLGITPGRYRAAVI